MMVGSNSLEEHIIDVDELVHSLTRETSTLPDEIPKNNIHLPVIHQVKQEVRVQDNNEGIYEPKQVSIGPYHHGSSAVQDMQKAKYVYLDYILKLNPGKKLADYLAAINGLEKQVRCSYANEIKMDRDAFLKTLLLDNCFILVALHGIEGIVSPTEDNNELDGITGEVNPDTDKFGASPKITQNSTDNLRGQNYSYQEYIYYEMISHDLLLLENQIPFTIVEKIYQVLVGTTDATSLLTKNIVEATANMLRFYPKETHEVCQPKVFCHLLHLCHMFFKPHHLGNPCQKDLNNPNSNHLLQFLYCRLQFGSKFLRSSNQIVVPSDIESGKSTTRISKLSWRQATKYQTANIEFKKKEISDGNPHYCLLDIGFCSDTMEIPSLTIDQRTYCLFRNLVAFEQACPQFGNYITAYVVFWSQLVTTRDDARMLTEKGILINQLQSDLELVQMLSSLSENTTFDPNGDYYLKPVCRMVEQHYQRQRSRWRELFGIVGSKIP